MSRLAAAALVFLMASPAWAQTSNPARDCALGSQANTTTDCSKPENKQTEVKPAVPETNMKDTVIPKSGAQQTPATTPTTGVNK